MNLLILNETVTCLMINLNLKNLDGSKNGLSSDKGRMAGLKSIAQCFELP